MGDVIVQKLEHNYRNSVNQGKERAFEWNSSRTFNIASFGVLINGPILAKWYPWLDKQVHFLNVHRVRDLLTSSPMINSNLKIFVPSKKMTEPIAKLLIEISVFDIPFLTVFFGYMNLIQGGNWNMFVYKIKHELPQTYITSIGFWSAVQLWNFRFVPIVYQSVVVHAVSIIWDGFLSYRNEVSSHAMEKESAAKNCKQKKESEVQVIS